jgi:deoxyadenosine/deoxycytidine kinase
MDKTLADIALDLMNLDGRMNELLDRIEDDKRRLEVYKAEYKKIHIKYENFEEKLNEKPSPNLSSVS